MPKKQKNNQLFENYYDKETLKTFLDSFLLEGNMKNYAIVRLLAYSGMRKGELFALKWNDIVFEDNLIIVRRSVKRGANGIYLRNNTKTSKPRLTPMDKDTMDVLKVWKNEQKIILKKLGHTHNEENQLVLQNIKNSITDPNKTSPMFQKIINKYNLPRITAHGLRHTHCSLLFEAGAALKEVQERLGHDDSKTTLDIYTHIAQKGNYNAIQKFNDFMN